MNGALETRQQALQTYAEYERQITAKHLEVGALLVMVLMPMGVVLDFFMYRDEVFYFLALRLACVLLEGVVLLLMRGPIGKKYNRFLGLAVALLPAFFICWMIAVRDGPVSPYYAGLNLILLAVAFVMRWSVGLSFLAFILMVGMWLSACVLYMLTHTRHWEPGEAFNNFYFLVLTGIIVITGSRIHRTLRVREFTLRYELDKSKEMLEESNRKLVELDQVKNRFFANISHELRTPLTLLIAPLETLLHRFNLDSETKGLLSSMHANGMRLLKLINDLLDLVRLESGRMEVKREPLNVADFVKGLASAARQVADDKHLRLETTVDDALGTVAADRDKLEKIILNLVFNALKFTPSGGRVELRAVKQGDQFVLSVADTGMGISAKNLPFIFDRFWQGDGSSKRKYQGVGIGLALVKELVEIQGGKVNVESQENKGTTFTVHLPYEKSEAVAKPASQLSTANNGVPEDERPPASEEWLANLYRRAELFPALTPVKESLGRVEVIPNGKGPTLLVADDEPDMLRFLKSQLQSEYQVLEAVDGQQAIEKATQFLPDIILLDMMMPEKDGLQACREIREHTSTQSTPIVLLTARADEETKLAALAAGASDFLAKPFSTAELHIRIKNLVESHGYQRKLSTQNQVLESTIEQLKDTETQLVQSEKLASLGRMSAGIIHEINNPLNFAATGLYTLRNKAKYVAPEQQGEYGEILKDVEEGITRVKNIVSDLRMFTHPDTETRDQVEIAEVLAASLRFLSNEWKNKIQIVQEVEPNLAVWGNKNKLIHVVVNLVQNSVDALNSKKFAEGQPTIWIRGKTEGEHTLLSVRDNGTGIDKEHLDKIFDPFFTTKDVGQGMGLGLAICYRIVQDYEGRILVRTEPGQFCEFTLEFPAKGRV